VDRLNPATRKIAQIQKLSILLFILVFLFLPVGLPASSSFIAAVGDRDKGGIGGDRFLSLQNPGRLDTDKDLAQGMFLVADPELKDPNFYKTVVLLIRYGPDGAAGLVINQPLNVKLSEVLPDLKEFEHSHETLYLGGPVEINKMMLLVKSAKSPQDSRQVFGDVYISSSREELQRLTKSSDINDKFRIYAGYAGWASGQLEFERDRGDWHVVTADPVTLFDKKSPEIWQELIQRLTVNWVYRKDAEGSEVQLFKVKRLQDLVRFYTFANEP
jgi:putative transcriptional regulator